MGILELFPFFERSCRKVLARGGVFTIVSFLFVRCKKVLARGVFCALLSDKKTGEKTRT
jgi:hypothetical protein